MNKYFSILRVNLIVILSYRANLFLNSIGNYVYIMFLYFLWLAIYSDTATINGISFSQTFVYLVLSSTFFNVFKTWTEWGLANEIRSGNIVLDLCKPYFLQVKIFFEVLARTLANFIWIGVPVIIVLVIFFADGFSSHVAFAYAAFSIFLAYILNFQIDYLTGLVSFYTESIWGISISKETVVLVLSGALVPMNFFPEWLYDLLMYTPFPYLYYVPISLLTGMGDAVVGGHVEILLLKQLLWLLGFGVVITLFSSHCIRRLTINGG